MSLYEAVLNFRSPNSVVLVVIDARMQGNDRDYIRNASEAKRLSSLSSSPTMVLRWRTEPSEPHFERLLFAMG